MYSFPDRDGASLTLRPEQTASCVRGRDRERLHPPRRPPPLVHGPDVPARTSPEGPLPPVPPARGRDLRRPRPGGGRGDHPRHRPPVAAPRARRAAAGGQLPRHAGRAPRPTARASRNTSSTGGRTSTRTPGAGRRRTPCACWTARTPTCRGSSRRPRSCWTPSTRSRATTSTRLRAMLDEAGAPSTVNPRLVRGLDYYTKTVFEWTTDRLGAQNAVCGGGPVRRAGRRDRGRPDPRGGILRRPRASRGPARGIGSGRGAVPARGVGGGGRAGRGPGRAGRGGGAARRGDERGPRRRRGRLPRQAPAGEPERGGDRGHRRRRRGGGR